MTGDAASTRLEDRLVGFARALRDHGIVVGPSDVVDAAAVARLLGWTDRDRLREGLAAALLRRSGERSLYDDLFDIWFPAALGDRRDAGPVHPVSEDPAELRARAAALREELAVALARGDARMLDLVAAKVVAHLGRLGNDASAGSFSAAQAVDTLSPQVAIATALGMMQDGASGHGRSNGGSPGGAAGRSTAAGSSPAGPPGGTDVTSRFTRDELRSQVAAFRRRVEVETRRRNAEARGAQRISRYAVQASSDRVPFLFANAQDVQQLRAAVTPLARRLATRMTARRRRGRRGPLDMRRTLRRSLGTGGIPIRPAHRPPRPSRPDIVLLCDFSSSVAGFSRFTILLMQALAAQFRRVRVFGFVNVVDELTELVAAAPPGADLTAALADTTRMTRWHRNSDYGAALVDFTQHHLEAVSHRTAVLILGDARTNSTDPRTEALRTIVERARVVHWLNPEHHRQWGSGDSVAPLYAEIVDMHECRDIAQLRAFVTRVLPV